MRCGTGHSRLEQTTQQPDTAAYACLNICCISSHPHHDGGVGHSGGSAPGPLALQHTGQCPPIPPHHPFEFSKQKQSCGLRSSRPSPHLLVHTAQTLHCDTGHTHTSTHTHTWQRLQPILAIRQGPNSTRAPGRCSCVQPADAVLGHRCSRRLKPSGAASPAAQQKAPPAATPLTGGGKRYHTLSSMPVLLPARLPAGASSTGSKWTGVHTSANPTSGMKHATDHRTKKKATLEVGMLATGEAGTGGRHDMMHVSTDTQGSPCGRKSPCCHPTPTAASPTADSTYVPRWLCSGLTRRGCQLKPRHYLLYTNPAAVAHKPSLLWPQVAAAGVL